MQKQDFIKPLILKTSFKLLTALIIFNMYFQSFGMYCEKNSEIHLIYTKVW